MRKKFKCIMTFLVTLILIFEVARSVLERLDKETINMFIGTTENL